MCHDTDSTDRRTRRRRQRRACSAGCFLLVALLSTHAHGQRDRASPEGEGSTWPLDLAAALTTCAATQCADADDAQCASTCDATRKEAPVCREVDCSECLTSGGQCAAGEDCSERVCVLCGWPDERGELLGACRQSSVPALAAPSAGVVVAALDENVPRQVRRMELPSRRAAWALYELKDRRYHLLLSGDVQSPAPNRPAETGASSARPVPTADISLRDRLGGMGILALIGSARGDDEGAVASIFSAGSSLDDSVRSSLDVPVSARVSSVLAQRSGVDWERYASDPGDLSTHSGRALPAQQKRAAPVTARVAGDDLIDVDGQVDTEHVERVLQRRKEAFQLCYEHALKSDASLSGTLLLDFDVGADGRVTDATVVKDEVASRPLARCVLATLGRIRFPAQQASRRFFTASLTFQRKP